MGEAENKGLQVHYNSLITGSAKTGNSIRDDLIVSDAKRHLADLITKNPSLEVKEEPKVEEPVEEPKVIKSKKVK